jgi:hypothetical protein
MTPSPPALALFAVCSAVLLGAPSCGSTREPQGFPRIALGESPGEFHEMRSTLVRLARHRDVGDAAGARAMHAEVLGAARDLLKMGPPHDLSRQRIPRFLEGRGAFGDAVNEYDRAVQGTEDAAVLRATADLQSAFHGWYAAYRGLPSEGSV